MKDPELGNRMQGYGCFHGPRIPPDRVFEKSTDLSTAPTGAGFTRG